MPRGLNPYDEAGLQGRLWTPNVLRPALWFDAADLSTLTLVSGDASEWRDKSGNGRHASQGTAALQPSYNATTLNSKPGITFDGTLKFLTSVAISDIIFNNSYSAFTVGRANSASSNDGSGYLNSGFWGDSGGFISNYFRSANLIGAYNWDGGNRVATQAYTFGTNLIAGLELSGGSIRLRQNGGNEIATASGNTSLTSGVLRIGKVFRDSDPNFNGVVSEVIFSKGHVSTADRQRIEGYLAWKWGIRLDARHPFVNRPPLIGD